MTNEKRIEFLESEIRNRGGGLAIDISLLHDYVTMAERSNAKHRLDYVKTCVEITRRKAENILADIEKLEKANINLNKLCDEEEDET